MVNWYERHEQTIAITAESSYGTPHQDSATAGPYGGSIWTALEAGYEDFERINVIPSGTTVPLPKIAKIKKYDVGDSKHPSKIASGNIEPIRFTMDLELIYPVFLAYAVGTATSTDAGSPYTHTVVESKTSNLKSFTMHCEQGNPNDSSNDIVYDLFGCIVEDYTLTINKGNGTVRESVTIACPYAAYSNANMNTGSTLTTITSDIYTWNDLLKEAGSGANDEMGKSTTAYLLQEDVASPSYIGPDSLEELSLTVNNNIQLLPDLEKRHQVYAVATRRDVSVSMSGYITTKTILTYWQEKWNNTNDRPDSASGALQCFIYLERGTDDYFFIPINNLVPDEHSCDFTSIEEGIKRADITLSDAVPPTGASDKIFYDTDDSKDIEIKDSRDKLWYHNTTP